MITNRDVTEVEVHKFSAFASDLGLAPGEWPIKLSTTLGNGQDLQAYHKKYQDGDLAWVDYWQLLGCISVRVFND